MRISLLILSLILAHSSFAQMPARDLSFGKNGSLFVNLADSDVHHGTFIDMDYDHEGNGYYITQNRLDNGLLITKSTPAGQKDTAFNEDGFRYAGYGTNGLVVPDGSPYMQLNYFIRVQYNQKRILVFWDDIVAGLCTLKMDLNGWPDSAYGNYGYKCVKPGEVSDVFTTADNGYLVQVGTTKFVKFLEDGSIDSAWGNKGECILPAPPNTYSATCFSTVQLKDNSLLVTEYWSNPSLTDSIAICKIKPGGNIDSTFGRNGLAICYLINNFGKESIQTKTCILPDSSIVVVATSRAIYGRMCICKFTASGSVDDSFSPFGHRITTSFLYDSITHVFSTDRDPYNLTLWAFHEPNYMVSEYWVGQVKIKMDGTLDSNSYRRVKAAELGGNFEFDPRYTLVRNNILHILVEGSNYSKALFSMVKIRPSMAMDSSLGNNGFISLRTPMTHDKLNTVIPYRDGSWLGSSQLGLFRINANGNKDSTFGINGIAGISRWIPPGMEAKNVTYAMDSLNRVLVGFDLLPSGTIVYQKIGVQRLLANGGLDSTFGTNGLATYNYSNVGAGVSQILTQPDNKVVVVASIDNPSPRNLDILVYRLNANGTIDNSFGAGGTRSVDLDYDFNTQPKYGDPNDYPAKALRLRDSSIIIVGYVRGEGGFACKLTANGQFDYSFGQNGRRNVSLSSDTKIIYMAESDTGRIYFATSSADGMGFWQQAIDKNFRGNYAFGQYRPFPLQECFFQSGQVLHNNKVVVSGYESPRRLIFPPNTYGFDHRPVSVVFNDQCLVDSSVGDNGVITYTDVLPGVPAGFTHLNTIGFSAPDGVYGFTDHDGNYLMMTTASKNRSSDIFITKTIIHDTLQSRPPSSPVITAFPSAIVCGTNPVTLTANSPGCISCLYSWNGSAPTYSPNYTVTAPGTWKVVVINSHGRDSSSIQLTYSSPPPKPVITSPGGLTAICSGQSLTLTSSAASGNQWYRDGWKVPNGTGQTFTSNSPEKIQVTAAVNGCVSDTSDAVFTSYYYNPPAVPVITAAPASSVCTGTSVTLSVSAGLCAGCTYDWNNGNASTASITTVTTSGSYKVTVNNGCGTATSAPLTVNIATGPAFSPTVNINTTCISTGVTLAASVTGGGNAPLVQWYVNNTLAGTGNSFALQGNVNGSRVYAKLTSGDVCANPKTVTSDTTVINCVATSVQPIDGVEQFGITPNPTSGILYVKLKLTRMLRVAIEVLDGYGRTVYSAPPVKAAGLTTTIIDLTSFANGVYYLRLQIGNKIHIEKIAIQK